MIIRSHGLCNLGTFYYEIISLHYLFVLTNQVDERKLREVFRLAGNVVAIEISRDKEGKSRGFAVIVYDHPVEAVQVGNQQTIMGRDGV